MTTVAWTGVEEWLAEVTTVSLRPDGVSAGGTQLGVTPRPYRAHYELDATDSWLTRRLRVEVPGTGWLELRHDGEGTWGVFTGGDASGCDPAALEGALDCDLAYSPLTNLMPIRRHDLHVREGAADFLMAWVSLPDLGVHRSAQHYEHVRPGVVRFEGEGFTAPLEVDGDGLITFYPELARRVV